MSFLRRLLEWPNSPSASTPALPSATTTSNRPAEPAKRNVDDPNLPKSTQQKLPALLRRIEEVEARAQKDNAMAEVVELQRIRDDHLEKILGSYLGIPREHLSEIYVRTSRSASFHLNDAVDKMSERVEAISRKLAEDKLAVFTDNKDYLMESYTAKQETDQNPFMPENL